MSENHDSLLLSKVFEDTTARELLTRRLDGLDESELKSLVDSSLVKYPPDEDIALAGLIYLLKYNPKDVDTWIRTGDLICKLQPCKNWIDIANKMFQESINIDPLNNYSGYAYLAQLNYGKKSLDLYCQAADICRRLLKSHISECKPSDLTSILISLSELFMTDLCDEDNAQEQCEHYLNEAISLSPNDFNVNVHKCCYSRIIMDLDSASKEAIQSINILKDILNLDINSAENESIQLPDLDTQLNLLQLTTDLNILDEAIQLGKLIIQQNSHDDRVWHRLSIAHMLKGELEEAEECCMNGKDSLVMLNGYDSDDEIYKSRKDELDRLGEEIKKRFLG